ncbi:MAG: BamA/TamA family outer membrane protein, partial [Gemmatimonadota bacterium]|nr:BamA/TamA family outer membrane protein [Gemmatimonadota bacterium]
DHNKGKSGYNVTPALNPAGDQLAFISDKSGYIDIWLANAIDGRGAKKLVQGMRSPDFESFRFLYTSLNWSPDGRLLTFVAKSGPDEAVYVYAMYSKKVIHKFVFGLDGVLTPCFSPDGEKIIFSGIDGGRSNLYQIVLETGELSQLTDDKYTQRDPAWSPDGSQIAFTTEYGPGTDLDLLLFSDYRIGLLDLQSGQYSILPHSAGDNISPQWSPDGSKLAYVSNRTGISNIFYYDFSDSINYQVTNILTGVAGPTENSPCISWSSGSGRLAFSAFDQGGWDIFIINDPEKPARPWQPDTIVDFDYETVHLAARREMIEKVRKQLDLERAETETALDPVRVSTSEPGADTVSPATLSGGTWETSAPILPPAVSTEDSLSSARGVSAGAPRDVRPAFDPADTKATNRHTTAVVDIKLGGIPPDSLVAAQPDSLAGPDSTVAGLEMEPGKTAGDSSISPDSPATPDSLPEISFDFDVPKEKIPLADTASFTFHQYKAKFTTDYVTGYGGYQGNIGVNGGVMLSLSDMLGNHNIRVGANVYGKIQDSDLLFQYMNLKGRTDKGFYVTQFRDVYFLSTYRSSAEYYARIWRGAGVIFSRPFSRFRRFEYSLNAYSISEKTFEQSFYSYSYYPDLREHNVQNLGTRFFGGPALALVYDNIAWGLTGPADGGRYRLSVRQYFGDLSYTDILADWRKYWFLWKRVTVALRGIGTARVGNNPQIFYIGGPYTFRGSGYGDIRGDHLLLGNAEIRFPLIDHLVMGWPLPIYLRGIGGVLFLDLAGGWYKDEGFKPFTGENSKLFKLNDAQAAYGMGLRINMGYFLLRFDMAKSLDHYATTYHYYDGQYYMSRELVKGRRRNFFSIGNDF